MTKRLVLIIALLAMVTPAMGQLVPGLQISSGDKSSLGHDASVFRVAVEDELLKASSPPVGYGSYVLIDGPSTEPGTIWYLEPRYEVDGKIIKKVRVTELTITTKQILGDTHPYLAVADDDVFHLVISYKPDPKNPVVDGYHNGHLFLHGLARELPGYVLDFYILKEIYQTIGCFAWNHTIGLAGPVGSLTWCVNAPWKSLGDQAEAEEDFVKAKSSSPKSFRGWLELSLEPSRLVTLQWAVTYKVKVDKKWRVIHNTGIIDFDADGDKIPNWYEIENGSDPFDPNDPNSDVYVDVPCEPSYPHVAWTLEDAVEALDDAGLLLDGVVYENSNTVPEGGFLRFSPPCGTSVLVGSEVNVHISSGPSYVSVPNLVGEWPNNVSGILAQVNLLKDPVLGSPEYSDVVPEGKVVRQWPVAGTQVLPGSMVKIALSLGVEPPNKVATPSIYNKTPGEADVILEAAGLDLSAGPFAQDYHPTVPFGKFISQTPPAGTQVNLGTVVTGVLSKGPETPNELVVTITSPADNFVGTVGQVISFTCTVTGGVGPYDNFKWHFPDNSFKYQQNVSKTFDIPGAGWCYIDVTDHAGNVAQDKVWVQINSVP